MTKRCLIPANGPEVGPIRTAFALLSELCENFKSPKDAILLIPTKREIQGTTLEEVLGSRVAKALLKGESVTLAGGGNLTLETQRTFRNWRTSDIIIGIYVTEKMLNQIDSAKGSIAVIIVPWIMNEVGEWIRTWNPVVYGKELTAPEVLIESPVVEEALKMLTNRVNLSTGLSHSSDKAAAVQLFCLLRKNEEPYNADSIRAWAIRNGWNPKGADQLRSVAQAVLERRPVRGRRKSSWSPNIIKVLRERAKGN